MDVRRRNNVVVTGREDGRPIVFAHGFGCDQTMWRFVAPRFGGTHKVVTFDFVGFGGADITAHDPDRYASLDGYTLDVLEILEELGLNDAIFVGHSVAAMIGVAAAIRAPDRIGALVLVGPSPRYIDDDGYVGGFSSEDIDGLLASLESNYLGWSGAMAPVIMGNPDRPELGAELTNSFCRTDPAIARNFARVTFLSDSRGDLPQVRTPTLVLQCSDDVIAQDAVGAYVHEHIAGSTLVHLDAVGHCPHLSSPDETAAAIWDFVSALPR